MKLKIDNKTQKLIETNYCTIDEFVADASRYIAAVADGRLICANLVASKSGMSRSFSLVELTKQTKGVRSHLCSFYSLLNTLGYSIDSRTHAIRVRGCGMNMIWHTNYDIIRQLASMGLMNKTKAGRLSQLTPHIA